MPGVASAPGSTLTASPTMKSSPQRSRIRLSSSAENRMRRSNVPPQSSLAAVRPRRPELVDDRVVGGEDLDPVEAAGLGTGGRRHEPVEQLLDLRARHRVAAVGVVVRGQAGRRPVRRERVVRVAVLADVVQLVDHDDVGVRGPAGIGHPPEGRDDRVVVGAEVAPGEDARAVDGHRLDDDHPGAAERALPVVPEVALAGQAVLGHVGGMGPERDPAPQRPMPQPEWFEHVRERLAHGAGSPPSMSMPALTVLDPPIVISTTKPLRTIVGPV